MLPLSKEEYLGVVYFDQLTGDALTRKLVKIPTVDTIWNIGETGDIYTEFGQNLLYMCNMCNDDWNI